MRAAVFEGDSRIEVRKRDRPTRDAGSVLVRVRACGVCGSERGLWADGADVRPGHEVAGDVVAADDDSPLDAGTRVVLYHPLHCGACEYCERGETNRCRDRQGLLGYTHDGGYAEYVTIPERNVIPLADGLSYREGVLSLDTIGTTRHGIEQATTTGVDRALVIGAGPLGLGSVFVLQRSGTDTVYAAEPIAERRAFAADLGGLALDVSDRPLPAVLQDRDGDRVPLIVDCVGSSETIQQACDLVAPGGDILILGEAANGWSIDPPMLSDYRLIRSWYFPRSAAADNQTILETAPELEDQIISQTVPLAEIESAFEGYFADRTAGKVIVEP